MELDFEDLIISEEQAHSFALAVFNDIRNYFLDLENYINSILKFSANVIQNIDLINNRLTVNRNELISVENKIKIEESKLINLTKEQIKEFLLQLKNGKKNSIKYKKTLITIFINRIYLYDDKLTIIFNVGKNPVTANFPLLAEATNSNTNELGLYLNKLGSP